MKRDPALRPLSDDHHRALVLARRVGGAAERRGEPGALEEVWRDAQDTFARELEPHFRAEEKWLFPQLAAAGEDALAERARTDHANLRALIRAEPQHARPAEFAECLRLHVRFEERELLPHAEQILSRTTLETAGRAALEARLAAGPLSPCAPAAAPPRARAPRGAASRPRSRTTPRSGR